MELSDLPEPASRADSGADALAPSYPPDRVNSAPARPFPWPSSLQTPPSPDALDNARRGTWVMNDYLDGWTLMGANGRPVMRADGSKVAFWFRDIDRLTREWTPTDDGALPPTKRRPGLAALDSGFDSDWDPAIGGSYRADVTKSARLLAYYFAQRTEPEEAVRRAVAMLLGDPVTVKEGNIDAFVPKRHNLAGAKAIADAMWTDLVGAEPHGSNVAPDVERLGRSESDDIADVYRAAGDKFRHGRSTGGGTSIFDLIVDIEKGALAGARDAAQEALEGIDALAGLMGMNPELSKRLALPEAWETETTGGAAARSISQFLVGFIPAFKTIKIASGGAALTKVGKVAQAEGAAAAASATVFDPLEERLSNTWQELGLPQNILIDYLAASPDDSEAEGRLKNAIESLAIGSGLAGGLALSAKILRAAQRAMTPRAVAAGGIAAAGLAAGGDSKIDPSKEGEIQDSERESILDSAVGAASAAGFAGSMWSVRAEPVRRAWEIENKQPWPQEWDEKKGKYVNYEVHHIKALRDGGTNDLENIKPMKHADHVRLHSENGDYSRWARQAAEEREKLKAAARKALLNVLKLGKFKGE